MKRESSPIFYISGWWYSIMGVVILSLGVLHYYTRWASTVGSCVVYPLLEVHQRLLLPLQRLFEDRRTYESLKKNYEALLEEHIALRTTAHYHQEIEELISFKTRYTQPALMVGVIGRQFDANGHVLFIDAGSRKGVCLDMVAVYKNCLIGRVSMVYPYYSKVLLITDPRCAVAATCLETRACGIHQGIGSLTSTSLTFVSHLAPLQQNDLIASNGQGLIFPVDLPLAALKNTAGKNCATQLP